MSLDGQTMEAAITCNVDQVEKLVAAGDRCAASAANRSGCKFKCRKW